MTNQSRTFATPAEGLRAFYEEEISGEAFFETLASLHSGAARQALGLMSVIEGAMVERLAPMAQRLGIGPVQKAALRAVGQAEAVGMKPLSWSELLDQLCLDYPAFVAEFEAVAATAQPEDRDDARLLFDHEVALLDYARAARAGRQDALAILESFLKRLRG